MYILTDALCVLFLCCIEILCLYKNQILQKNRRLKQVLGLSPVDAGSTSHFWTLKVSLNAVLGGVEGEIGRILKQLTRHKSTRIQQRYEMGDKVLNSKVQNT